MISDCCPKNKRLNMESASPILYMQQRRTSTTLSKLTYHITFTFRLAVYTSNEVLYSNALLAMLNNNILAFSDSKNSTSYSL